MTADTNTLLRVWLLSFLCAIYGLVLSIASLYVAGGGDGSYVLAVTCGAPYFLLSVSLCKLSGPSLGVSAFVLGTSAWWAYVGYAIGAPRNSAGRPLLCAAILLHYLTAAAILMVYHNYVNWAKFVESLSLPVVRAIVVGGLVLYVSGQLAIWWKLRQGARNSTLKTLT